MGCEMEVLGLCRAGRMGPSVPAPPPNQGLPPLVAPRRGRGNGASPFAHPEISRGCNSAFLFKYFSCLDLSSPPPPVCLFFWGSQTCFY